MIPEGDYYSVSVARIVRDEKTGAALYHDHLFTAILGTAAKKAATGFYEDFRLRYPEPEFHVALQEHIRRCVIRRGA